jgi:hypothetical protein
MMLFAIKCTFVFAQYSDTLHYHLNVNSTGSLNRTNTGDSYLLNNAVNFGIKQKAITLNSTNSWIYGRQNNVLTNNDFSSSLYLNYYQTFPHFYYWGLVNYNTSYSLKINNQLLTGAGIAYNFIDTKLYYLNLSDGILYDQSDLLTGKIYHTYRNSLRLLFQFSIGHLVTVEGSNFLQNSLSNGSDYIIRSNTTALFRLYKWLSLTAALNYNRSNITGSENLLFTYGVTVDRYFR